MTAKEPSEDAAMPMHFSWSGPLHWGIRCDTCKKAHMTELTSEQAAKVNGNSVAALRIVSDQARSSAMHFYMVHSARGHDVQPVFAQIAPIAEA